ncbi:MAG: DNA-binding transcriptional LysR family regulator [Gammaproteobacteria bacterium]|jgi:DNA-binding transcriptional LysR family regulator
MVRNTTSLLAMVRAGIGVTVLPRLAVNNNADDIEFVAVKDRAARRQIDLLRRAHTQYSPAAQQFAVNIRTVAEQVSLHATVDGDPV